MKLSNRVSIYTKLIVHSAAYSYWISLVVACIFGISTAICAAIASAVCILFLIVVMIAIDHAALKSNSLNSVELILGPSQIDTFTTQSPIERTLSLVYKALDSNKVRNIQTVNDDTELKLIQGFVDGTWLYPGSKLTISVSATNADESKVTITCQPNHDFNHLDNGRNAMTIHAIQKTLQNLNG
ncbi:MAG: hypothetical protein C0507_25465 [Cyanobacteria bacterium PR.3.49]|nr:hypothetical protein [Cyanobacteria bacterium PR.3.49]